MKTINSKKLLPSGQDKKQVFLVPVNSIIPSKPKLLSGIKPETKDGDSEKSSVISEKISDVTKLIRYGLLLKERDKRRKRREQERKKRDERERELETKKLGKKGQQEKQAVKIPGSSIFDRLMRFAGFTLLGFLFNNFGKLLPALNVIGRVLKPAAVGIMYFAEGLLSNTVDWIEKGYKAYDAVSEFAKEIGGENFQKLFNDFSGALTLAINGVIIAGAAALRGGLFKRTGPRIGGGASGVGRRGFKRIPTPKPTPKKPLDAARIKARLLKRREFGVDRRARAQINLLRPRVLQAILAEAAVEVGAKGGQREARKITKTFKKEKVLAEGGSGTTTATRSSGSTGTGTGGSTGTGTGGSTRTGTGGSTKIYTNLKTLSSLSKQEMAALGPEIENLFKTDPVNDDLAKTEAKNQMAEDAIKGRRQRGFKLDGFLDDAPPVSEPPRPGRIRSRGFSRILPRALLKTTGSKTLARVAGRIPVIGPLVDFVISIILGDRPDKAAAGAVGAAIGAAVGSFIPIPFVGSIAGGVLGDIIGRSLYDVVLKMTGMSAEKFNKGGMVGPPPPVSPPPPLSKEKKKKEPEPDFFKDSLGTMKGEKIYGGGDKEEYEKVFGIIKGTYDNILNTSGGFISSLMAGAIGLLAGNDFNENLLKHVGDRHGITAVNGMRDLSTKTKDMLNRESSNIKEEKKDKDGKNQWWDFLDLFPNPKSDNGKNQWWDFLDLFPNSQSDSRGSDSVGGKGGSGGMIGAAKGAAVKGAAAKVANDLEFQQGVEQLAQKYNVSVQDLYAVMSFETGGTFDPAQKNRAGSGATGLIQFMPSTAKGLGTSTEELSKMTRTEQLKYVDKYFSNKGIEGGNLDDLYMSILFPVAVGKPDDFVLFGKGAIEGYRGIAYEQNSGLDVNRDGSITKAEAAAKVRKHYSNMQFVAPPTPTPIKTKLEPQRKSDIGDISMTPAYNSIELHTVLVQPVIVS